MKAPYSRTALSFFTVFLSLLFLCSAGFTQAAESETTPYTIEDWLNSDNWDQLPTDEFYALLDRYEAYELFTLAPRSDGAYSAALGSRFHDGFRENPVSFADHLLAASEETRNCVLVVTFSIVHSPEDELLQDKSTIHELTENVALTDEQIDILLICVDTIDTALAQYYDSMHPDTTKDHQDSEKLPPFDPYGVNDMIDHHFEFVYQDEEFFKSITQLFLSYPEAFLEFISDRSPSHVRHLAKGIAYTLYKTEADAPSLENFSPELSDVCSVFQYELENPENHAIDVLKDFSPAEPTVPATSPSLPVHTDPPAKDPGNNPSLIICIGLLAAGFLLIVLVTQRNKRAKK